jgi:ankyrin repeat protein
MCDNKGNSLVGISTCKGDLNMVKLLVKNHFEINLPNKDGNTPLHFGIS